jgi:hypothetical protein
MWLSHLAKPAAYGLEVAFTAAPFYLVRMLQRTLLAGVIAPCLPTKTDKLPSGSQWLQPFARGQAAVHQHRLAGWR